MHICDESCPIPVPLHRFPSIGCAVLAPPHPQACDALRPQDVPLAEAVRSAAATALRRPGDATPAEMFDNLCRLAGVPTVAEDLAAAQANLIGGLFRHMEHDPEIVWADS